MGKASGMFRPGRFLLAKEFENQSYVAAHPSRRTLTWLSMLWFKYMSPHFPAYGLSVPQEPRISGIMLLLVGKSSCVKKCTPSISACDIMSLPSSLLSALNLSSFPWNLLRISFVLVSRFPEQFVQVYARLVNEDELSFQWERLHFSCSSSSASDVIGCHLI